MALGEKMMARLSLPGRGKLVEGKIGTILLHLNKDRRTFFQSTFFFNEYRNSFLPQ